MMRLGHSAFVLSLLVISDARAGVLTATADSGSVVGILTNSDSLLSQDLSYGPNEFDGPGIWSGTISANSKVASKKRATVSGPTTIIAGEDLVGLTAELGSIAFSGWSYSAGITVDPTDSTRASMTYDPSVDATIHANFTHVVETEFQWQVNHGFTGETLGVFGPTDVFNLTWADLTSNSAISFSSLSGENTIDILLFEKDAVVDGLHKTVTLAVHTVTILPGPQNLPEPSSLVLLGMGMTGVCGYRLRRKRHQAV